MNIIKTNLEFNANKTKRNIEDIKRIILHNSGVTVLQSVEVIHDYHKNTRGYAGIGYHYYVRKDGSIYEGRSIEYIGAHAGNNNSDSIGICFEGKYDEETMPEAQIKAGQELVAYLKEKYNITKVQRHNEVCNTSCPGTNFPFGEIVNRTVVKEEQTTKSIVDLANEVIAGKYGSGQARKQALGSLYNEVQAKVNEILGVKTTVKPTKSINEIVDEVIAGKWGVGEDRKTRLKNAGYNYETVQSAVNSKLKGTTSNKKSLEEIANEVIEGKWGNGEDRRLKLSKAGYDYNAVQKIVNKKLK